jgi:hypothetical protein
MLCDLSLCILLYFRKYMYLSYLQYVPEPNNNHLTMGNEIHRTGTRGNEWKRNNVT